MFGLSRHRRDVPVALRGLFFRRGPRREPAVATVVAHPAHRCVVNDRGVVDIMNVGHVHVHHCAVVEKVAAIPTPTHETYSEITESVIDSAIEADVWTPITFMENKCAAAPTPPAGRP